MNTAFLYPTLALGALTGMRSMAGPAVLALRYGGALKHAATVMAAGEMIADKTSLVGDRTAPVPLAGRALMGALVGGVIARDTRGPVLAGAAVGGAAAVIAAQLAYRARRRVPLTTALGGIVEDALVVGIGAWYVSTRRL